MALKLYEIFIPQTRRHSKMKNVLGFDNVLLLYTSKKIWQGLKYFVFIILKIEREWLLCADCFPQLQEPPRRRDLGTKGGSKVPRKKPYLGSLLGTLTICGNLDLFPPRCASLPSLRVGRLPRYILTPAIGETAVTPDIGASPEQKYSCLFALDESGSIV